MSESETDLLDLDTAAQIQQDLDADAAMDLALRRLLFALGEDADADHGEVEAAFSAANRIERLEQRVAELEDTVDRIDRAAETALTIAETQAEPGDSVGKKKIAKLKSRNELVRRAAVEATGDRKGAALTVPDVQEMAKPEVVIHYQSVKDAWDELIQSWDCFSAAHGENDQRQLRIDRAAVSEQLAKAVESALDRDDLTKRLISEPTGEGR